MHTTSRTLVVVVGLAVGLGLGLAHSPDVWGQSGTANGTVSSQNIEVADAGLLALTMAGVTIKSARAGEAADAEARPRVMNPEPDPNANREMWFGINFVAVPVAGTEFINYGLGVIAQADFDALLFGFLIDFAFAVDQQHDATTFVIAAHVGYEFLNVGWMSLHAIGGAGVGGNSTSFPPGPIDPNAISGEGFGIEILAMVGARWLRSESVNFLTEVRARFPTYALVRSESSQAFGTRSREFWVVPIDIVIGVMF